MSTVPTASTPSRFSRTSVALLIGVGVILVALAAGFAIWKSSSPGEHTAAPSSPPPAASPAVSPAVRPSGVPYYTKDEMEILREQARMEERNRLQLERQYGSGK